VEKDPTNPNNKVFRFDKMSAYYLEKGTDWKDYTFTFDVMFVSGNYAYFMWAVSDARNWYAAQFRLCAPPPRQVPHVFLGYALDCVCPWGKWFGGGPYPSVDIPGKFECEKWYTGKVVLTDGKGFSFYVEDQLVLENDDTNLTTGSVGVGGHSGTEVYFDNITITGPSIPASAVTPVGKLTSTWAVIKADF